MKQAHPVVQCHAVAFYPQNDSAFVTRSDLQHHVARAFVLSIAVGIICTNTASNVGRLT